jgi:hypothetical protein
MSLQYEDTSFEDELGFLPVLAALAPTAIDLVGKALKGKKKGKKEAPSQTDIPAGIESGADIDDIKTVVAALLATVPPPIQAQVRQVVQQLAAEGGNAKQLQASLVKNIEAQFLPTINKALGALTLAQTQREATSEHNSITQQAKRWETLIDGQRRIDKRLSNQGAAMGALKMNVDRLLAEAKIIPRSAVKLAGGDRHLDILSGKAGYEP